MQVVRMYFLIAVSVFVAAALSVRVNAQEVQTSESQGHTDRIAFESWLKSLVDDQRHGAEFWARERSKSKPASCLSYNGISNAAFTFGCQEAQKRLSHSDVRRRTEPNYRRGWNASLDGMMNDKERNEMSPRDQAARSASNMESKELPWYFASSMERKCTAVSSFFPPPGNNSPSTPEGIVAGTGGGSVYRISRPAYGPVERQHEPGPVVQLTDLLGKWPTLALVQGERACQEALAVILETEKSGSAEERWAIQNERRAAEWQVVYWNHAKGCTPLSNFIPGAVSLEDAVSSIKQDDPDAYLVTEDKPNSWERVIRTQGHSLRLVRNQYYCRVWLSLMRSVRP